MAKESTNLGRKTVGEQTLLSPETIAKLQAQVQAEQAANPELAAEIESIASEVPVITDPTQIYDRSGNIYQTGGYYGQGYQPPTQVYTASDGKTFTDQAAYVAYEQNLKNTAYVKAQEGAARQSAYDLLYAQFKQYGLEIGRAHV